MLEARGQRILARYSGRSHIHTRHDVGAKDQDQVKAITRETEVSRTGE